MARIAKGHVEQLPSGSSQVSVYAGVHPLTRPGIRLRSTVKDGRLAQIELGRLLKDASEGRTPEADATVARLLDEYAVVAEWDVSTRQANEGFIRRTIKPALGHLALLAVAATAACRALWLRGSAIIATARQARNLPGRSKIFYTEDEAADAYTLPGWPCRIVVTTGMLDALSQPERRVLLAHERAHAAWLHYLFTAATRLAAAANPLLRPVIPAVGYTVERWADERAAALTAASHR